MAENEYICQECTAAFNSQAEREQHSRMEHSHFHCDDCDDVFESELDLESHNSVEHPQPQESSG